MVNADSTDHWPTIDTYPPCELTFCQHEECDWGPTTLLAVDRQYDGERYVDVYVGHKEAGMWVFNTGDVQACDSIEPEPSRWHPIP
jgi:hypothetical protein